MDNIGYIQSYLHEHIPLSYAMGVQVLEATSSVVRLSAPLAPNINHRETIFGGSASALAILSAWCLVHFRLRVESFKCRVVIQKNTISYNKPILGSFEAKCSLVNQEQWEKFTNILKRKGKSRIIIGSTLEYAKQAVGEFEGSFVAVVL